MDSLGWSLVLSSAGLTAAANVLLRLGLDQIAASRRANGTVIGDYIAVFFNPFVAIGLFAYGFAALLWMRVLSSEPLSVAYPLLVSCTFALVTLAGVLLFRESANVVKLGGLLLILAGI